jgi:hypothetical protein
MEGFSSITAAGYSRSLLARRRSLTTEAATNG